MSQLKDIRFYETACRLCLMKSLEVTLKRQKNILTPNFEELKTAAGTSRGIQKNRSKNEQLIIIRKTINKLQ